MKEQTFLSKWTDGVKKTVCDLFMMFDYFIMSADLLFMVLFMMLVFSLFFMFVSYFYCVLTVALWIVLATFDSPFRKERTLKINKIVGVMSTICAQWCNGRNSLVFYYSCNCNVLFIYFKNECHFIGFERSTKTFSSSLMGFIMLLSCIVLYCIVSYTTGSFKGVFVVVLLFHRFYVILLDF